MTPTRPSPEFDAIVIGAGVSGLICACRLGQAGKRVLLVEQLGFLGGRFTAFAYQGAQVSSGAFHTFPHGGEGPMAQALRRLGIDQPVGQPAVFAGLAHGGAQFSARSPLDLLRFVPNGADRRMLWRCFFHLWLRPRRPGSLRDWLNALGASPLVQAIFDRFCQFALSVSVDQLKYNEGRAVALALMRFGLPGVPAGGARAVTNRLAQAAAQAGVVVWKTAQAERLLLESSKITGAEILQRRSGETISVRAPLVIHSAGPRCALELLQKSGVEPALQAALGEIPAAVGLKIHFLSPASLVEHEAILFCLDTRRVAGIIQITNSDPSLAPPGQHLLISHQVLPPGADWHAEMDLALQDWRDLFGPAFENCEVLGASVFPQAFPVNWAAQGSDLRGQPFREMGLWLVGDGMKPAGLMMVEGAAASAEAAANQILGLPAAAPWEPTFAQQAATWSGRIARYVARAMRRA